MGDCSDYVKIISFLQHSVNVNYDPPCDHRHYSPKITDVADDVVAALQTLCAADGGCPYFTELQNKRIVECNIVAKLIAISAINGLKIQYAFYAFTDYIWVWVFNKFNWPVSRMVELVFNYSEYRCEGCKEVYDTIYHYLHRVFDFEQRLSDGRLLLTVESISYLLHQHPMAIANLLRHFAEAEVSDIPGLKELLSVHVDDREYLRLVLDTNNNVTIDQLIAATWRNLTPISRTKSALHELPLLDE